MDPPTVLGLLESRHASNAVVVIAHGPSFLPKLLPFRPLQHTEIASHLRRGREGVGGWG